jgi:uncharacterized Zn-binding protein involved in type VI secretion
MCSGHANAPPRANTSASTDVFVDGKGVHRVGDSWGPHGIPPHTSTQSSGSSTVIVNGKGVARVGDSIACGSTNAQGSSTVFAG